LTEAKSLTGRVGGTSPDRLDGGQGETVTEFDVPADKRLLQVQCQFSPAQTQMLQKIFAHVQGVAQVKVTDTGGNAYLPVGKYIIADQADGTKLVELIYDVSPEAIMASRPEPFRQVKVNDLEGKGGTVGFLYLIPPGTQLKEFQAGGRPFQTQTLQIKAPQ